VSDGAPLNRNLATMGLILATSMNSLDTTVVNVSLPHMRASLSASPEQITWVITSYIVASAVMTPLSGWLARRFSMKVLLLASVATFTVISVFCGVAGNLEQMVGFRLLQGIVGAPLMPIAQAALLNIYPAERHGRAMALYMMAIVAAPVCGPMVGGFLTDQLSWRWCFYINVPAGIAALLLIWSGLPKDKADARRFDFLGFGSLAVGIAALQLMVDRGPTLDWFSSHEIWIEAIVALIAFWVYLAHTITAKDPLFPTALFRDRNYVAGGTVGFLVSWLLYCSMVLLPLMMQGVLGYSVAQAGALATPRGLVMLGILQVIGRLDAIFDRRLLICFGLSLMSFSFVMMGAFDLSMTHDPIIWSTVVQGIGQGIFIVPLTTLTFLTIPADLRADASTLSNLLRNIGGSVGVAAVQALTATNIQTMHASLAANVRPDDPVLRAGLAPFLRPDTAAGATALNDEITRQATMVAYVNDFWLLAAIGFACLPLILMLRQPKRGASIGEAAVADAIHA